MKKIFIIDESLLEEIKNAGISGNNPNLSDKLNECRIYNNYQLLTSLLILNEPTVEEKELINTIDPDEDILRHIQTIEDYYNALPSDTHLESRKRKIVKCRQIAHWFILRKYGPTFGNRKLTVKKIGYKIGKKDHATVLHSFKVVNNEIETDPKYRQEIKDIEKLLNS